MSTDQSQTAANTQSEPRLCKMGCGFFGNGATEDCCSKCFLELQKKKGACQEVSRRESKPTLIKSLPEPEAPQPMEVDTATPTVEKKEPAPTPKKKKKKTSYKAMMAAMTKPTDSRDIEMEKESLRKVTGGGAFSKIDKI